MILNAYKNMSLTRIAHDKLIPYLYPGAIVIDATAGNGHDSLFLVEHVYPDGKVFAFDIQATACAATQQKLQVSSWGDCLCLQQASHADLLTLIPAEYHGKIAVCMFNLGFLPGSDKTVITETDSTLAALSAVRQLLAPSGVISVMVYPGHAGGELEAVAVEDWCFSLDARLFSVQRYVGQLEKVSAPKLLLIQKHADSH